MLVAAWRRGMAGTGYKPRKRPVVPDQRLLEILLRLLVVIANIQVHQGGYSLLLGVVFCFGERLAVGVYCGG